MRGEGGKGSRERGRQPANFLADQKDGHGEGEEGVG